MLRMAGEKLEVAVIGAGIVGIAVAYHLCIAQGLRRVVLVDPLDPMSLTSAQSGENYRNWWPHPLMTAFTDHSIGLMERIAADTDNRIAMTRRGYALVTRHAEPTALIDDLHRGYAGAANAAIRVHDTASGARYAPPVSAHWQTAPDG